MAFLKDTCCSECGGAIRINAYYDEKLGEHVVDGGTCVDCFNEVILPVESYYEFCRLYGTGRII